MAALLALRGERPTTAQGLTRALLNHERRYWSGLFSGHALAEPERYAEQLLALATLAGGFVTPKAVLPHWKRVSGTVFNSAHVAELFYALIPLYPGKQGLQAVRPDLLGEALVAQALLRPSAADLLDAVLGKDADESMRSNALTVLARLSDNYQELHENLIEGLTRNFAHCWHEFIVVAVETPSNFPLLAEAAFARLPVPIKNQITGLLKSRINDESVQLVQFYCLVSKFLVNKCEQKYLKKANDIETIDNYAGALSNYANRLNDAGRNEEALEHGRQALEIRQRLAQKNPDRFEPNYATSLSNYASHLKDAGRNEEGLEHGRQALEIHQRLAQKNPDRFEPDYATSLSNYASHLSDVGRNEEALEHGRQALEIHQRLAQKNPAVFEGVWFSTVCNTHFQEWMADDTHGSGELAKLRSLPESTPPHHRPLLKLHASFVQACCTSDQTSRFDAFKQVTSIWRDLSKSNRIMTQGYWMCAAAWRDTHEPSSEENTDWKAEWHQFIKQRQGHVPCWMLEAARRLKFEWSE
jgi:tetratricopeptide (TPR) repeat protein